MFESELATGGIMRFWRRIFFWFVILGLSLGTVAQERFSGDRAFSYIEELCKLEYGGRKTGLPGARRAAEWIGSQARSRPQKK